MTRQILKCVHRACVQLIILGLAGYRRWISPMLPGACRFEPTCSQYAMEAVLHHGAVRGGWYAIKRVVRCCPLFQAGYDPVPPANRTH